MRLGVNMMLWTGEVREQHKEQLVTVKRLGYDGVEIPLLTDTSLASSGWLSTLLRQMDLACTASGALPPGASLLMESEVERGVAWIKRCIDATAALGGEVVCGPFYSPVGQLPGRRRSQAEWELCVHALRTVGEYAGRAEVLLAVEPINRFETFFLNTVEDGMRLIDAVGSPHVRLLLDTFHMNIEENDIAKAVRCAAGYVGHFHCSENHRGPIGTGHIPWPEVWEALGTTGYSGWCVVESFSSHLPELARAACMWRDLATSEERLAEISLRQLQRGTQRTAL